MAKKSAIPNQKSLSGLHDIGLLVNCVLNTEEFKKSVDLRSSQRKALHLCEEEILGFSHCDCPASTGACLRIYARPPDMITIYRSRRRQLL